MTRAEVISVIALLVAFASLGFSVYFKYRDRAQLRLTSQFYPGSDFGGPHISVAIVNAGRRPIILRMWGGTDGTGKGVGEFFGEKDSGLRLGEHERFDLSLEKNDLYVSTPNDDVLFEDLWVEDSLGRRHFVKDAKSNIRQLWKA